MSSTTIPGDFEFRPAYILMKFIEEEYDEVEADLPKSKIRFNQWPSGQVALTIKCSSTMCNVNKGLDRNQFADPFFRYFQYKEYIRIDIFQTSSSNQIYPNEMTKLMLYVIDFIRFNRTSLQNHGINEIYIDSVEHPNDSRKDMFHIIINVTMKYTKTEIHLPDEIMYPAVTGNEPLSSLETLPENILMDYIMEQYPTDPDQSVIHAGLIPKAKVRFMQEYSGQGMLAITIKRSKLEPEILDNAHLFEYNNPEIIITADVFSSHPSQEDELGNLYWKTRKFFEYIFRMPRALRSHDIPLIELTKIIERDTVSINSKTYKGDIFRILFYANLTYMLRPR